MFPEESGWFGPEGTLRGEEGVRPATSKVKFPSLVPAVEGLLSPLHHPVPVKVHKPLCQAPEIPCHTPQDVFLGNTREGATLGAEKEKELDAENLLGAEIKARRSM